MLLKALPLAHFLSALLLKKKQKIISVLKHYMYIDHFLAKFA